MDIFQRIAEALSSAISFVFTLQILGIAFTIGIVALITWVVKKVWYAGSRNSQRTWLDDAQEKHDREFRNKYEDILEAKKVRDYREQEQKRREEFREKYRYDKHPCFEEWIEEIRKDGFKGNSTNQVRWYPTGWTWNDEKQLWEPPDYVVRESDERWEWDKEKRIWIDKEKAAKMEKYRQYRATQPMSFEEWKAKKEKEKQNTPTE